MNIVSQLKKINPIIGAFCGVILLVAWRILYKKMPKISVALVDSFLPASFSWFHIALTLLIKVFLLFLFFGFVAGFIRATVSWQKVANYCEEHFALSCALFAFFAVVIGLPPELLLVYVLVFLVSGVPIAQTLIFLIAGPLFNKNAQLSLYLFGGIEMNIISFIMVLFSITACAFVFRQISFAEGTKTWLSSFRTREVSFDKSWASKFEESFWCIKQFFSHMGLWFIRVLIVFSILYNTIPSELIGFSLKEYPIGGALVDIKAWIFYIYNFFFSLQVPTLEPVLQYFNGTDSPHLLLILAHGTLAGFSLPFFILFSRVFSLKILSYYTLILLISFSFPLIAGLFL